MVRVMGILPRVQVNYRAQAFATLTLAVRWNSPR